MAILALPMLVVFVSELLLAVFADTNVMQDIALRSGAELAELTGRYRFLSVFFFYAAVTVSVIGIFCAELFSRHTWASVRRTGLGVLVLLAFTQLYTNWDPDWMGSFKAYELVGATLFRDGLLAAEMPFCDAGNCDGKGGYFAYRMMMTITNNLSGLAVTAVILGMVLALARPAPIDLTSKAGVLAEGTTLQDAQKATRRYLYLAGVLLTVGQMFGLGWMMWPAELMSDPEQARGYGELVQSISLYRGVSYTVLILSFYMPVSLIQMVRIERFHAAAKVHGLDVDGQTVRDFDIERIGTLDALKAILSILSPILAAALGSFTGINVLGG